MASILLYCPAFSTLLTRRPGIGTEQMKEFTKDLLSQFKYVVLINGNLQKEDAERISALPEKIISSRSIAGDKLPRYYSRLLPEGTAFLPARTGVTYDEAVLLGCNYVIELPVPNPDQVNSAISYYCHSGNISDAHLRATTRLLSDLMKEPCFNMLRTKEQLGYCVSCSTWEMTESIGLRVLIQSEKDPKYLETRIEAFLAHMQESLETMPETKFDEHKQGLAQEWTEKLKALYEETNRFWTYIANGYLDFTRLRDDANRLANITKDDVLSLFRRCLYPDSTSRSKLSVHMRPQKEPAKKLSLPAAKAFLVSLREAGAKVDEEVFFSACSDEPTVSSIKEHWQQALDEQNIPAEALLMELNKLAEIHPATGQGSVELRPEIVFVTDLASFRENLKSTEFAKPVAALLDMTSPEC